MAQVQPGTVIIAVGDEILQGFTLDSNSHWIAKQVREAGFPAVRIEVVGDNRQAIVEAVGRAVADRRVARVLVCGGLGPTPDDRTLEALAAALGRPLARDGRAEAHVKGIVDRMHSAGWVASSQLSEANRRMTVVPQGATVLENRRGMAPGLAYPLPEPDAAPGQAAAQTDADERAARWLVALPGVPRELQALLAEEVLPRFFNGGTARHVGELRYRHAIEAELYEPLLTLEREFPELAFGSYPQTETRELIIRVHGPDPAQVAAALQRLAELRPRSV